MGHVYQWMELVRPDVNVYQFVADLETEVSEIHHHRQNHNNSVVPMVEVHHCSYAMVVLQ